MQKSILMLGATLFLSGCGIYTKYEPQTSVPDQLYGEVVEVNVADTTSIGSMDWRELFKDPRLQALIEKGLENNTDLRTAQLRVEEAKASLLAAKLSFLPGLSFSPQGTISSFNGETSKTYTVPVTASWELDIFGKLRNAKKQAAAAYAQSEDYQQAVRSSLIANIANTYYTLLMLDEQLALSEETAQSWKETVRSTQALMNAGLADESSVSQMTATYYEVKNSVVDLKEQINQVENSLALLLAETPHAIERGRLAEQEFPEELAVGVPVRLLSNRPDVRQAEQQLIAANAAVGIAYTSLFPTISLTAQLGAESEELSDLLKSPYHLISGSLLQPIVGIAKNQARLKARKAARERALYAYEKAVLSAFKDAYDAIAAFNKMQEIYDSRLSLERSSRSALDLAQLQYVNGVIGYMDLLDAQRSYLDAQIGLSNAVRDKQITIVHLYKALGGGWE